MRESLALGRHPPMLIMPLPETAELAAGKLNAHALQRAETGATRQSRGILGVQAEADVEREGVDLGQSAVEKLGHKPQTEQGVARDANLRTVLAPTAICFAGGRRRGQI